MKTIEVNGEEFELAGDPSMGTVKYVQELQISILQDHLTNDQIASMDSMGEEAMMEAIVGNEDGVEDLKDMMWKNNLLETAQTIILATDHKFTLEEFDDMGARNFLSLKQESEVSLGSEEEPMSAQDFMEQLGVGISSRLKRVQERAEEQLQEDQDSQTTSQNQLLTE